MESIEHSFMQGTVGTYHDTYIPDIDFVAPWCVHNNFGGPVLEWLYIIIICLLTYPSFSKICNYRSPRIL